MRLRLLFAFLALLILSLSTARPTGLEDRYLARLRPRADGLQAFAGKIEAFDPAAKTITLRLGSSLVFHLTDQTRITDPTGPVTTGQIKVGEGATIVMRPGKNGARTALTIKLDHHTDFPSEATAHTRQGKTVIGPNAMNFLVSAPPERKYLRGSDFAKRQGLFGLTVLPDGTVASVKVIKSLGIRDSDKSAVNWLKQWKFQPNSVTESRCRFRPLSSASSNVGRNRASGTISQIAREMRRPISPSPPHQRSIRWAHRPHLLVKVSNFSGINRPQSRLRFNNQKRW